MEKREALLYAITIFSLMTLIYIVAGAVSKIPAPSEKLIGLAGNAIITPEENLKAGDNLQGEIIIAQEKNAEDAYGILLLEKNGEPIITKTFNLKEIPKNEISPKKFAIKIEELVSYNFEEKGRYELFFSVLDLDVNIKKEFVVE
ncbi:MAG: hypothetical protein Q8N63_03585 [Nanoarchaeota archaeon]|nr:hypothetical protein [Nanoarchaeota archaeon]